ncbi:MAG: flagellar hook-associated protein FlgK [Pseudolabrys sp.]|nr:flagellar hook-associated protein FlgK [Pseudolabrys sp.]
MSGLKANQSALALVSSNVANAGTAGYVRKTTTQVAQSATGTGISVRVSAVQRELDVYVQRQLRVENSGASYATARSQFYNQLQSIYGQPGASNSFDTIFNNFTESVQALSGSPDDAATRSAVVSAAQLLTQQLNSMTKSIQGLRGSAELGISDAVSQANDAMQRIADLNVKLASTTSQDATAATMMDQRDAYIDKLSRLMDINVIPGNAGQVTIYTTSGVQLVSDKASRIDFSPQGTMNANTQWSSDPNVRQVGTLSLTTANGSTVDLIESKAIRSGSIAAFIQMRDEDLVQAQAQLDEIASVMARALSDKTTAGTAVTSSAQDGFTLDISGLSSGNKITISYTDSLTNTARTINLVRVDDPSALPLSNDFTADPKDKVFGIDFSAGMASVFSQIANAIGSTGMVASNPSGTTLQVLNDGPGNVVKVNALTKTETASSLAGGSSELPFFMDGTRLFTGAINGAGSQSTGFAGRITLNSALVSDPSKLVAFASGTAAGDSTRPDFIYEKLTGASLQFSPTTGIGATNAPFTGSITTYLRQVISVQGQNASAAASLKQGQDVVQAALQERFDDAAGVNIDEEMANLLQLQNAYAANARVMSVVKDMLDTLMQM